MRQTHLLCSLLSNIKVSEQEDKEKVKLFYLGKHDPLLKAPMTLSESSQN